MAYLREDAAVVHDHHYESANPVGWIVGLAALLLLLWALFIYGVPAFRGATTAPQVNVPGKIDVNVNNPGTGGAPAPAAPAK